eukprot:scaffold603684_cov53-Prasinocladus_malaysianus.AAC.1
MYTVHCTLMYSYQVSAAHVPYELKYKYEHKRNSRVMDRTSYGIMYMQSGALGRAPHPPREATSHYY